MSGLFITMEGIDGSGKSTQIQMLEKYLLNKNFEVTLLREPGGTKIGEQIRNIILDNKNQEMNYITEALLYASSRAQLVNEIILPQINDGNIVLCDRFVDSSIVYQGIARGIGEDIIININNIATSFLTPDITFFLKISPEKALKRKKQQKILDRLENEKINFYNKVYDGYLNLAKKYPDRIKVIDASKDIDTIHKNIIKEFEKLLFKAQQI